MIRHRLLITGVTLSIATLVLTGTPATAEPDPAAGPFTAVPLEPPPGMIEAMQRDLGLSAEQAAERLVNERRAGQLEPKLRNKLQDRFAGSWVTDRGALVVATTDAATTPEITALGVRAEVMARPLAELDAVKERLDRFAETAPNQAVPVWYVDVRTNAVVVLARDTAAAERFVTDSGADRAAVRIEATTEQPVALADVRGGDAYFIDGQFRCSVGFSVTQGGTGGFVTAGHCGDQGSPTTGANEAAQGTFRGSSFPGNDYAWVAVNSQWTPRGVVNGYGTGDISVAGSADAPVGSSVCRSGSTTGWHCGAIQQRNTSVTYVEGTVNQVVRTSVCAERGDSGGSFISGDQAQGVTSGGSGNCTVGGTTYFQPVNEILGAYNLTLVTGGGTQPPPPGCTGYQETLTGTLANDQNAYQPGGGSFQTTRSGTHRACLDAPNGTDFDLYLQRRSGSRWVTVASGATPAADETLTYNGAAGTYRYRVHAYTGSGSYTLGMTRP